MIPKIIHYCWLSNDAYPEKIRRCIETWKNILPDYEIILWDTKKFDIESSIWVKQAFESKKYAFAADYIRLYALYNYGGVYLDSDVEVLKSFNDLLERPYFICSETSGLIEAAVIGAEPHCDWIKASMEYYTNRPFIMEDGAFDIKTIPHILDQQIKKIKPIVHLNDKDASAIGKFDLTASVYVLPNDYFSPKVIDSRDVIVSRNTYCIHHYTASWYSPKAKVFYKFEALMINIFGRGFVKGIERTLFPKKFK